MKNSLEDIKRAFKTFIEAKVTSLSGKVFATYPENDAVIPCCVVDIVSASSDPLIEGGLMKGLARVTVVDDDTMTLDQLFDDVYIAFVQYGYAIEDFSFGRIFSISPLIPAVASKDEIYKREMDIEISWIVVR
ncbi:MAG TPA: hypothetical protein PLN36_01380 [Bacteroidales bacterium]|nr:hypothetical protein [Bacteroidales bacterium]HRT38791.1 hypothetical protein [Rectinema sp.]